MKVRISYIPQGNSKKKSYLERFDRIDKISYDKVTNYIYITGSLTGEVKKELEVKPWQIVTFIITLEPNEDILNASFKKQLFETLRDIKDNDKELIIDIEKEIITKKKMSLEQFLRNQE